MSRRAFQTILGSTLFSFFSFCLDMVVDGGTFEIEHGIFSSLGDAKNSWDWFAY